MSAAGTPDATPSKEPTHEQQPTGGVQPPAQAPPQIEALLAEASRRGAQEAVAAYEARLAAATKAREEAEKAARSDKDRIADLERAIGTQEQSIAAERQARIAERRQAEIQVGFSRHAIFPHLRSDQLAAFREAYGSTLEGGEGGKPVTVAGQDGRRIPVQDAIAAWIAARPEVVQTTVSGGAGTGRGDTTGTHAGTGASAPGGNPTPEQIAAMTPEQWDALRRKGLTVDFGSDIGIDFKLELPGRSSPYFDDARRRSLARS